MTNFKTLSGNSRTQCENTEDVFMLFHMNHYRNSPYIKPLQYYLSRCEDSTTQDRDHGDFLAVWVRRSYLWPKPVLLNFFYLHSFHNPGFGPNENNNDDVITEEEHEEHALPLQRCRTTRNYSPHV